MTRKINTAILGCGGIGSTHAERLSNMNEAQVVAVCDLVREKAERFSKTYGGSVYTDFREMFERESLDAVYVCLPPFAHSDEVAHAAEKGISVFIEKPIALDMSDAQKMVREAEKHGIKTQVGYQCRFGLGVEKAKSMIDSGEAGAIGLAIGEYLCNFLGGEWWRDRKRSGGQVVEQSTHLYDLMRYLCGDVKEVYGLMDKRLWTDVTNLTMEDVSTTAMRFVNGAIGSISASIKAFSPTVFSMKWKVVAQNHTFEFHSPNEVTIHPTASEEVTQTLSCPGRDLFMQESNDFIKAILEDAETRTPIEEGARTLKLTLAVRTAMETGGKVNVEAM